MCGAVRMTVRFPSRFCAHCHCESCRRAHAAGFVTWIGFQSEQVTVDQGAELLAAYESSSGTRRTFCNRCGTPVAGVPAAPAGIVPAASFPPAAQYAGFWLRFVAALIDGLLIEVVVLPLSFIVGLVIGIAGAAAHLPQAGIQLFGGFAGFVIGTGASWLYAAYLESSARQATVGKMVLSLRVTDLDGHRISFGRATGRHFAKYVSLFTLLIGYIMAGFTERKQALHDMIAGTLVVRGSASR